MFATKATPASGPTIAEAPPPFWLPTIHFAPALGFLVLGATGIWISAEALAVGAFLAPSVTATTHLFTMGWLTLSIMGALYQFLPVALGHPIRWPRLAPTTVVLYTAGLLLLVAGLFSERGAWAAPGGVLLGMGTLLFAANLGATLPKALERDLTWWALALATGFLVVTVLLGAMLAGNLQWWFLGADRLAAIGTHLHVAVVGWVMLVVVGVGHRLLPMFLLSHGADERFGAWAVGLLSSGCLLLLIVHHVPTAAPHRASAILILTGMAAFLLQARLFFRHRRRRDLDAGLTSAAAGIALVAAGTVAGAVQTLSGLGSARLGLTYVMAVILGLSVFVAGHYYKIIPFLVFYHRWGPRVGRGPVPLVADLYSAGVARLAGTALSGGTAALVVGVFAGSDALIRFGAAGFLLGSVTQSAQLLYLLGRQSEWES